jgi:hypothetical protein
MNKDILPLGEFGNTYICIACYQKWWCYNSLLDLWSEVDDDATWKNILKGCLIPVSIGNPSKNVDFC